MNHILSKAFSTGTWFSTIIFFLDEFFKFDVDVVFKSIMAMLSFTLLVLQITNQWHIRRERRIKESKEILIDKKFVFKDFKESLTEDNHENLKKMKQDLINIIAKKAKESSLKPSNLLAFVEVEAGGKGFDEVTGKIIIQFEPSWMKKLAPYAPSGLWSVNKVDVQSKEWIAFNDAFKNNPDATMQSTSIGLPQIMGFHFKRLGFKSVGEMWDFAKESLDNQIELLIIFIKTDKNLLNALKYENWDKVASIYNGSEYKKMSKKWGREPYDISMKKANEKYLKYNT